jgi:hypothetical protein
MQAIRCAVYRIAKMPTDAVWLSCYADDDRLLGALTAAKAAAGVKNKGMAFCVAVFGGGPLQAP